MSLCGHGRWSQQVMRGLLRTEHLFLERLVLSAHVLFMADAVVDVETGPWKRHLVCRQNPAAFLCAVNVAILARKGDGAVCSVDAHDDGLVAKALWQDNGRIHVKLVGGAKDGAKGKVVEWTASQLDIVNVDMLGCSQRLAKLDPGQLVHMESADVLAGRLGGGGCRVHIKVVAHKHRAVLARVDSVCLFSAKALRGAGQHNVEHFVGGGEAAGGCVLLLWRRWRWRQCCCCGCCRGGHGAHHGRCRSPPGERAVLWLLTGLLLHPAQPLVVRHGCVFRAINWMLLQKEKREAKNFLMGVFFYFI